MHLVTRSIALTLYRAWSARGGIGFAERKLRDRLAAGKEDPARVTERRGIASVPRPQGPLIWFHAASVGEATALVELISHLLERRPNLYVLVTTGTVTSATVMQQRLPNRAIHQYVPLDTRLFVTRFLNHWRPNVAIWTESDLWPTLIYETHARGVPLLMVNGRISAASYRKWRFVRGMVQSLLCRFDYALIQDSLSEVHFRHLGMPPHRMEVAGSLKENAPLLPVDADMLRQMRAVTSERSVWLAASTHPGEEAKIIAAHGDVLRTDPRFLLILVPRHPGRGKALAETLRTGTWAFAQRSVGEMPGLDTQIYLADTIGELGLWYRLAPISFIGGSWEPVGGHNPYEPASLGSAILHGPFVDNFADIYHRLGKVGAARLVMSSRELGDAIRDLVLPDNMAMMTNAALGVVSAGADVTERAATLILDCLDGGRMGQGTS